MELKVFENDADTYIAYSVEDAMEAFKEMIGDDYVADGYGDADDWSECNLEGYQTILFEDKTEQDFDDAFEVLERSGDYFIRVKAKYKDWIKWNGRGFLCSTEY